MGVKRKAFLRVSLPLLIGLGGLYALLYFIFLPSLYDDYVESRYRQTRDMSISAWHVLQMFHKQEKLETLSRTEAQTQAIAFVRNWRYGPEGKDYFWITDTSYRGVLNPYRPEHEGRDLSDLADVDGKRFIVVFAEIAKQRGEGFTQYTWQWKDDPTRVEEKTAFVKLFAPWGWVIGTGVYEDDLRAEFASMRKQLAFVTVILAILILSVCFFLIWKRAAEEERREIAEQTLRSTEMNFQQLVESVNIIILCMDTQGCITYINEFAQNFFGFAVNEIRGKSVVGTIVPATDTNGKNLEYMIQDIVARPEHYAINENENCCRDGRRVWIAWANQPILDASGNLRGVYSVGRDITALKMVEDRLRQEESRHRLLFEISDTMVVAMTMDGRILDFDETAETLTGYRKEEVLGKYAYEIFLAPDERSWHHSFLADILAGKKISGIEKEIFIKGGYRRWVLLNAVPKAGDDDSPGQILVSAQDVTQKHLADEGRRISEQRLYEILAHSPLYLFCYSMDGRLLYATDNMQAVFHVSRHSLEESRDAIFRHLHPDDKQRILPLWEQTWAAGDEWNETLRISRNGQVHPLLMHVGVIYDSQRRPASVIGVAMDAVSPGQPRRAEFPAGAASQELQKMEIMGRLAGCITHDFKNLLGGIVGNAELLQLQAGLSPEQQNRLHAIIDTANRATNMIRQLMSFCEKKEQAMAPLDLHGLIRQQVEVLSHMFGVRIYVECVLQATHAWICADPGDLENLLMNLAVNARDAMPGGGTLRFSTTEKDWRKTREGMPPNLSPGQYVVVEVSDTGEGIPLAVQERMFEPFFTTKPSGQGTGIGLANVQTVMLAHGGAVEVQSSPGEGTTFRLYFPLVESKGISEPRPSVAETASALTTGNGFVLLVDDEELICQAMADMLRMLGYTVHTCHTGEDAVAYYEAHVGEIDLVILDMIMPGINGDEAFRKIRAIHPDARVLIASGFSEGDALAIVQTEGICGVLDKPVRAATLSETVARILGTQDKPH